MKQKLISSLLFANIYSIPYFFVGSGYEFIYKSFFSVYSSYLILLLLVSFFFYLFFTLINYAFKDYKEIILEIFAIFYSIFIFKAFVYSANFPTLSHFLSKFGYNFVGINKIFIFSVIIIFFAFISIFLNKAKKNLVGFYHTYSVILILFTFYYYIFDKPVVYAINKNEVSNVSYNNQIIPDKRVIFIIFDELDYELAFNNKDINLKTFETLRSNSVTANNFYSASNSTLRSVPGMLTGKENLIVDASKRKRQIKIIKLQNEKDAVKFKQPSNFIDKNFRNLINNLDKEEFILNYENSIFSKIPGGKKSSYIVGKYFSYCMIFNEIECYDDKNFVMNVSKSMMTKLMFNDYLRKFKSSKRLLLEKEDMFMINWQLNLLEQSVKKFDKSFVYLHLHPPHPPNIFYGENKPALIMKKYIERMQIADNALNKILQNFI